MTVGWFGDLKRRHEALIEEYGKAAIATYFTIFFGTLLSFWLAIKSGVELSGAAGSAGTIGGAYLATKLTQPVRIGVTLVLTPAVVGVWRRLRGHEPPPQLPASSPED
ncbi:MAG TPA: DUF1279 domain-containing protein [Deltaproteobacteria bacterium]|nr:DUF1279 domain-containing protein [Deltaproteobacteria bacterium]